MCPHEERKWGTAGHTDTPTYMHMDTLEYMDTHAQRDCSTAGNTDTVASIYTCMDTQIQWNWKIL